MLAVGGLLLCLVTVVWGQGALYEPPARGSMWRFGFDTPTNWRDHFLNCGGMWNQFEQQGGKCGVCGDPYQGPREHEKGGKYATGKIARVYRLHYDWWIDVQVDFFNAAMGYMEFSICDVDYYGSENENCFNRNQKLTIYVNGEDYYYGQKYFLPNRNPGIRHMQVYIPDYFQHKGHLILRWRYHSACCWGCGTNGDCCVGCGPKQEEFYGCSDIYYKYWKKDGSSEMEEPSSNATIPLPPGLPLNSTIHPVPKE